MSPFLIVHYFVALAAIPNPIVKSITIPTSFVRILFLVYDDDALNFRLDKPDITQQRPTPL